MNQSTAGRSKRKIITPTWKDTPSFTVQARTGKRSAQVSETPTAPPIRPPEDSRATLG